MNYEQRDTYGIYRTSTTNIAGPAQSHGPGPHLMGAETLIGNDVYNGAGEHLGDVKEIMLDMRSGRVSYAVLSFGGFLGMGEKLFAVPWEALRLDTQEKRFVLDVSKSKLESAPGFDRNHWPDMADTTWQSHIHRYYEKPAGGSKPVN
ncbi:MAG: PRC-barrel domain-containing protein [Lysobacterales bacterium]|jgi:sporulation protein YlmC with PRC-barrel domain